MSTSLVSLASLVQAFNPVTPQLRVAAVIVRQTQILLVEHRKRGQRYWVLPGGSPAPHGRTRAGRSRRELRRTGPRAGGYVEARVPLSSLYAIASASYICHAAYQTIGARSEAGGRESGSPTSATASEMRLD